MPMEISATGKYIRVTPRKLVLVARGLKSLAPQAALTQLEFIQKSGAKALRQVIASALANAKQQNLEPKSLVFTQIAVTPGGAFKRFRAVSRGMAHEYKKRMSHVRVVLTTKTDVKSTSKTQIAVSSVKKGASSV